ncbi:class I SAM-dependent methyltransferase [Spirosoma endophyticum]|uniref:Methyltransferase domain-containing protein n=1 Tax=Spirosoma endophyticum TaxID=662367 RepID=A0A1I2DA83_9BACT|nr:class I SAM-dependent methyltransferase [Spirosoma endophyticum]SFE77426.1 Methyltransferase domain-containing protein [Spirosoma endophyticum]
MNMSNFFSFKYLKYGIAEVKETRNRARQNEVYIGQLHSLLMLRDQVSAIPPANLQIRVSGSYYTDFFLHGQSLINKMNHGLAASGVDRTLTQFENVLDFGCGCGRTLIPLAMRSINAKGIHGVDIDAEAVTWLTEHYSQVGSVKLNPSWPTMLHDDQTFDLVFAISVFTHLPEDMEHAWLADISRVLRQGGYALLTIHGDAFFHQLTPAAVQTVQQEGFFYASDDTCTDGLPQFYKNSYHTESYIQERWSQYFDVINVIPTGIDQQDLVILRKR